LIKKYLSINLLFISVALSAQSYDYELFKTSVNSKFAEFGVSYFKGNSVLFASSKKNDQDKVFKSDRRRTNKQLFLELYQGELAENGDIIQEKLFSNEVNNRIFEADITFTPDFKTVYFTWNNFFNTRTRRDSAKWRTLHMVKAEISENNKIIHVEPMPFNSTDYSVRNPAMSSDGKRLFFSSDMEGGHGGYDIYAVEVLENGYGEPVNLGQNVNTKKDELFPFPDSNGNVYFASDGHRGPGGLDIYKSEFSGREFGLAYPLPDPINSKADDFAFVLSNNEEIGFITSNRKGGDGDVDIYKFVVKEKQELCTQLLELSIYDAISELQLVNSQVIIYKNEEFIEEIHLHGGHTFTYELICNSDYRFVIKKNFYSDGELTVSTNDNSGATLNEQARLNKLDCVIHLSGQVVDSNTKVPLPEVMVQLFKDGIPVETLTLDNNMLFNTELKCNSSYQLMASKTNYRTLSVPLLSSLQNGSQINKILELQPIIEIASVRGERMIKTNPILFELNEYEITDEAAEELDKLVSYLNKYPTIELSVRNHTDSRAPDAYNMTLSNNRAMAIVTYLRNKGIASIKVSGRGFGETRLINKCSNGVSCSDAEHAINKRTEFVIIKE
jgi:outer membrane protein OmpA-like peptidoglycan-associated protein